VAFVYNLNLSPDLVVQLLGGRDSLPAASLWLVPDDQRLSATDLEAVVGAFLPRRCALWRLATNTHLPADLRSRHGAFAADPELVEGILARSQLHYENPVENFDSRFSETVYSDIGWLAKNQFARLAQFIAESRFGKDATLAFLPDAPSISQYWCNIVLGRFWLAMNGRFASTTATPLIPTETVAKSVIATCVASDIIPTLSCRDSDMKEALVFWGRGDELRLVIAKLANVANPLTDVDLQRWLKRGAEFVI
jgi:hypothetical protein